MAFIIVLGITLHIFLAFWPATLAKNKGYSFLLFLVLSWFVSFLITLIVVLFLRDKNMSAADRAASKAAEAALQKEENSV